MNAALVLLLVVAQKADKAELVQGRIDAKGEVWVGQRVTLVVKLYSPTFFSGAPAFDLPVVPGVVILPPQGSPTLGSEAVGDDTYTVQRHELAVYPQRAGAVRLPPIRVRFATDAGIDKPPVKRQGATKELTFAAKMPPGAEKLSTVVTTPELTVTEAWKPEPGKAKVGAAFKRTVTVRAKDVPGMVLPLMRWYAPEGVAIYPSPAAVTDYTERGEATGQRVESVTYVCEKPGTYRLSGVTLAWWDAEGKMLRRERLPPRTFEVAGTEATGAADPAEATPTHPRLGWFIASLAVLLLAVAVAVMLVRGPLLRRWRRQKAARADSEAAWFARFRRACRVGDAAVVYQVLRRWRDRLGGRTGPARLEDLAEDDGPLRSQLDALQSALFGPVGTGGGWSAGELLDLVAAARKRLLKERQSDRRTIALPPLNPVCPARQLSRAKGGSERANASAKDA